MTKNHDNIQDDGVSWARETETQTGGGHQSGHLPVLYCEESAV